MKTARRISLFVFLAGALVLTACGGQEAAADEVTYVDGIPQYGCLGTAEDAIVDLECQEITFAVENAYMPFNYIVTETNQADGWDYEVFPEICTRLHCTPVFVETVWETMIQQVQEGQFDIGRLMASRSSQNVMKMVIFQLAMSIPSCAC